MQNYRELPKKVLIISRWAPPSVEGSPLALYNLLINLNRNQYSFLTSVMNFNSRSKMLGEILPCKYYFYDEENDIKVSQAIKKDSGDSIYRKIKIFFKMRLPLLFQTLKKISFAFSYIQSH